MAGSVKVEESPLFQTESTKEKSDPLVIKIGDKWINAEAWAKVHPGGRQTIERFRGQDATDAFESLHSKEALEMVNKMKNVESSLSSKTLNGAIKASPASISFRKFRAELVKEGWFERDWKIDFTHIFIIIMMAVIGTYISYSYPIIASLLIGLGMQQAGWVAHDYVHGRGKMSKFLGITIGGLYNGFSGKWWSDKHNKHHVHTNQLGVDDDIQNDPILHLWIPEPEKDHQLRPYQHLYYHIVYAFLYISWRIQSFQYSWGNSMKIELFLMSLNYIWLLCLPIQVAIMSVLIGGLLVAEVVTATHQSEEMLDGLSYNFVEDQFRTTRDVTSDNFFVNYVWGGMQYQLEHHLFPTMPKYRYPILISRLKKWAAENGCEYRTSSLLEIMIMNYNTMKRFATAKVHKS